MAMLGVVWLCGGRCVAMLNFVSLCWVLRGYVGDVERFAGISVCLCARRTRFPWMSSR